MEYTVTEFRKNIREILNAVDSGAEVKIKRYDREYVIVPTRPDSFEQDDLDSTKFKGEPVDGKGARIKIPKVDKKVSHRVLKKQANKNLGKLADAMEGNAKKAMIETPKDPCPHGYQKGLCKRAACNRKFAK